MKRIALAALLLVAAAAVAGVARPEGARAVVEGTPQTGDSITVSGSGSVSSVPDDRRLLVRRRLSRRDREGGPGGELA